MKKYIILVAMLVVLVAPIMAHAESACYYFDKCLTGGLTDEEFEAYHGLLLRGEPINYALVAKKIELRHTKEKLVQVWADKLAKDFNIGKDMILGVIGK